MMLPIVASQSIHRQQQPIIKPKVLLCTDLRTCGLIIGYLEVLSGVATFLLFGFLFASEFLNKANFPLGDVSIRDVTHFCRCSLKYKCQSVCVLFILL